PPHPPPRHHLSSLPPSPPTPHTTINTSINRHLKPLHLFTTITTPRQPRHPLHAINTAAPSSPHLNQHHCDYPIIIVTPTAAHLPPKRPHHLHSSRGITAVYYHHFAPF
nr:hypothetical protein [Tanacetum cinerariifolium]